MNSSRNREWLECFPNALSKTDRGILNFHMLKNVGIIEHCSLSSEASMGIHVFRLPRNLSTPLYWFVPSVIMRNTFQNDTQTLRCFSVHEQLDTTISRA
jgi:hypothetical protein